MPLLQMRMFGPPSILVDGEPLPRLKTRKGMWLVALLILRRGREVDRNWLAGTLWPDAEETTSLTYLRQTLTDLRKALGPAGRILRSPTSRSLLLELDVTACDVSQFDALCSKGTPDALQQAVELYTGQLLEGCTEEWVFQERESRTQVWLQALESLAVHETESGNPASAIRRLKKVISAEPLRESAYRDLLRALAATGDFSAAINCYRELRLILRRELNIDPCAETAAVYESVRAKAKTLSAERPGVPNSLAKEVTQQPATQDREEHREPAQAQTAERTEIRAPRVRLPRYVSEFIGREREMNALRRSLAASRLVTLTGVGGVGKTRLAVKIAEDEASRFPISVGFVDFAPISESSLVAGAAAAALGLREHPSRSGSEVIASFVDSRPTLLVLDNCEHILASCAELASDLLKRCPNLRILATSRQRLRITGETEWRVAPLEVPPTSIPTDALAAEALLRSNEALALFMDRARRVRRNLVVDVETLRTAGEVCRRLDGIPLALELAAARLQALTIAQLAGRLEERFKLLVTGDVTAPGRQQTLRAMLDWSHELLTDSEKVLFRRLAVFTAGWTLEAAEVVCSQDEVQAPFVLDGMSSLVEKSLISFSDAGKEGRYGMLETVRQYAREKLARSGEEMEFRRLHRDCFLSLAEQAAQYMTGPTQTEWMDRLETEHDNLRTALDWCVEDSQGLSSGLRLAGALHRFWFQRAHFAEGRRWYSELLRLDNDTLPTPERAQCLHGAGNMAYRRGQYTEAGDMFARSLAIWKELGDQSKEAELSANLGNVRYFQANYDEARQLFRRTLALPEPAISPTATLIALHGLGNTAFRTGDLITAREQFEQCCNGSRELGNLAMEATAKVSLGLLYDAEREETLAKEHFTESLCIFRQLGDVSQEMICLTNLGMINRKLGNYSLSAEHYRNGLLLAEELPGNRDERVIAYMVEGVARLAASAGKRRQAVWLLAAGEALRISIAAPRPPLENVEFEQFVADVRAEMDQPSFDASWSDGLSSRADAAILAALEVVAEQVMNA